MSNRTLASQIRDARSLARLSQQDLADRVGVARQAVSQWERGEQTPTDANLGALRAVLGASFGQVADATFSQLQRLHGRSEELEALQRYLLDRQTQLTAALASATSPYGEGDDSDQPEAAAIPPSRSRSHSAAGSRPQTAAPRQRKG